MKTKTELIKFDQGLDLESGGRLDTFDLMIETYGQLNDDKDNAILVCHAFSGNHHATERKSATTFPQSLIFFSVLLLTCGPN